MQVRFLTRRPLRRLTFSGHSNRGTKPAAVRGDRRNAAEVNRAILVGLYPLGDETPPEGVASYTRSLARGLRNAGVDVEVWAEQTPRLGLQTEVDGEILVSRVWRKGFWAGLDLWRHFRKSSPGVLHAQMEYFIFGGSSGFASVVAFLTLARMKGRKIVVTFHQVIGLGDLTRETTTGLGLPMPVVAVRWLLRASVMVLYRVAHRVIVHERVFLRRLIEDYRVQPDRLDVVVHGMAAPAPQTESLPGGRTLLLFGYLRWYKGVDIVLRAFQEVAAEFPDWKLIIAGGPPPRRESGVIGRRLLRYLENLAAPVATQVEFKGYVADAEIPALFGQAGICLFPYRVLFSFSGPLALALGYQRPVVLSEPLRPLLPDWPFWCRNSPAEWAGVMRLMMSDETLRSRARELAGVEAGARAWPIVAVRMIEVYKKTRYASDHSMRT